jgi:hypothetical protein
MAQGDGDQRGNDVLAALRHHDRHQAPRLVLAILQYALLACALVALVGSAVMYATDR